jgi:excisionase family DNA binding protein
MTRPIRFITAKEAASYLRITPKTIYEMCKRDQIPHVRVGYAIRIPLDPFHRWLRDNTSGIASDED